MDKKLLVNRKLRNYLSTTRGKLVAYIIHDFFDYYGMDSTLSVFKPESFYGQLCGKETREQICKDLNIPSKEKSDGSLLDAIIDRQMDLQKYAMQSSPITTDAPLSSRVGLPIGLHSNTEAMTVEKPVADDLGDDLFFDDPITPHILSSSYRKPSVLPSITKKDDEEEICGSEPSTKVKLATRTLDSSGYGVNDNYDEDFQSSASLHTLQKSDADISIEDDIEENLSEVVDELLSGDQSEDGNTTADNTASHIGSKVDYMENLA